VKSPHRLLMRLSSRLTNILAIDVRGWDAVPLAGVPRDVAGQTQRDRCLLAVNCKGPGPHLRHAKVPPDVRRQEHQIVVGDAEQIPDLCPSDGVGWCFAAAFGFRRRKSCLPAQALPRYS
jgi:hypothetical protein